ncbi:MAG: acyl carrier protein [bacterium]
MEDVLTKIQQAFHDAFDVDSKLVSIDTTPDDIPGWDSVGHLALASSLESAFGVTFDVDDLMEMENVHEIVRILQSKLKKV